MPTGGRPTLTQFLIEERRRAPGATGDLNALITDVAVACKAISRVVAYGAIGGTVSEELARVYMLPAQSPEDKYGLLFDPLDGSDDIDVNVAGGSIFSIVRAAAPGVLQAGTQQVCAGYAIYGPSTMLVLTLGRGTHAFTLEPMLGEWILSHPHLKVPEATTEFAINASNSRFWEPAVKRYVDECLAGRTGPRRVDFGMRWIASLVAETHRILMRGGVFLDPLDSKGQELQAHPRLLYEANPIALMIEQAGGRASDGRGRLLETTPTDMQQRSGFVFGSANEVARIESYHREAPPDHYDSPLFGSRGLFAQAG